MRGEESDMGPATATRAQEASDKFSAAAAMYILVKELYILAKSSLCFCKTPSIPP